MHNSITSTVTLMSLMFFERLNWLLFYKYVNNRRTHLHAINSKTFFQISLFFKVKVAYINRKGANELYKNLLHLFRIKHFLSSWQTFKTYSLLHMPQSFCIVLWSFRKQKKALTTIIVFSLIFLSNNSFAQKLCVVVVKNAEILSVLLRIGTLVHI